MEFSEIFCLFEFEINFIEHSKNKQSYIKTKYI